MRQCSSRAFGGSNETTRFHTRKRCDGRLAGRSPRPTTGDAGDRLLTQPASGATTQPMLAAFRRGLTEAGYTEGKNVRIEFRDANFKPELLLPAARDLVRLNVDVIVVPGGPILVGAARDATSSIPIVAHDLESDPLAKGWIKTLARPGGNMTGFFLDIPEMAENIGASPGSLAAPFPTSDPRRPRPQRRAIRGD